MDTFYAVYNNILFILPYYNFKSNGVFIVNFEDLELYIKKKTLAQMLNAGMSLNYDRYIGTQKI